MISSSSETGPSELEITTGYNARPMQRELHKNLRRFSVLVLHRRAGKSVFAINHLLDRALRNNNPMPRYAYIAPNYAQGKRIIWSYLHKYADSIPGAVFNEAELRVDFPHNQARIMILSGENYTTIKGIYLDGCVLDEYAEMSPLVWEEAIRPTLSDRKGWCMFISTPRGNNHFYDIYQYALNSGNPEWYGALFRASETGIIDAKELESARATMEEATYMQEYEVSFSAGLVGAYFTKELDKAEAEKRITVIPYDPALPVDTAWDLGISDTTAVWFFQVVRGVPRAIDYYEVSGISLPEIISDLQKKNYVWGEHLLPHDARARDLSTGKSIEQLFYTLGFRRVRIVPRVGSKRDSINAARMLLNKTCFDKDKCAKGIKSLYNYKRKWNEKNACFDDHPLHNWASNAADAYQQFALGMRENSGQNGFNETLGGRFYDGRSGLQSETAYDPLG